MQGGFGPWRPKMGLENICSPSLGIRVTRCHYCKKIYKITPSWNLWIWGCAAKALPLGKLVWKKWKSPAIKGWLCSGLCRALLVQTPKGSELSYSLVSNPCPAHHSTSTHQIVLYTLLSGTPSRCQEFLRIPEWEYLSCPTFSVQSPSNKWSIATWRWYYKSGPEIADHAQMDMLIQFTAPSGPSMRFVAACWKLSEAT